MKFHVYRTYYSLVENYLDVYPNECDDAAIRDNSIGVGIEGRLDWRWVLRHSILLKRTNKLGTWETVDFVESMAPLVIFFTNTCGIKGLDLDLNVFTVNHSLLVGLLWLYFEMNVNTSKYLNQTQKSSLNYEVYIYRSIIIIGEIKLFFRVSHLLSHVRIGVNNIEIFEFIASKNNFFFLIFF